MNLKFIKNNHIILFLLLSCALLFSCGAETEEQLSISGRLILGDKVIADSSVTPTYVIITKTDDFDTIVADPEGQIIAYESADFYDGHRYEIDLLETGLIPGNKIYLLGFIDNQYEGGIPSPEEGDFVGFYIDGNTIKTSYKLEEGSNTHVNIDINREVFDFDATINGTITGNENGNVILVAFTDSSSGSGVPDIDSFDTDTIIAYSRIKKRSQSINYSLDILPYGYDVPIGDVYVVAVLDKNGNGKPDEGENVGFYVDNDTMLPTIIVDEGVRNGIDISLEREYHEIDAAVEGSISGVATGTVTVVAYKGNLDSIMGDDFDADNVVGYTEIEKDTTDPASYKIDVLPFYELDDDTDIEGVYLFALIDLNGNSAPDNNEIIGFYSSGTSPMIDIPVGGISGIDITLDKTYYDYDVSITGTVQYEFSGGDPEDIMIVAYTGDFEDLSDGTFSVDDVAAYSTVTVDTTDPVPYEAKLLPVVAPPLTDVYVIAFRDTNGDGEPGDGEKIGYYFDDTTSSLTIDVTLGGISGVDIILARTYYDNTNDTAISGSISGSADDTMVTVVAYQGGIEAMDVDSFNPDNVVALVEIFKPGFSVDYTGEILPFYQFPIDDVFVFAMIDSNGDGKPGVGETVGFYSSDTSPTISITAPGTSGVDIILDKTYHGYDVSIAGTVQYDFPGGDPEEITIIAYKGDFEDLNDGTFSVDDVIAFSTVTVDTSDPVAYEAKLLPVIEPPLTDVYVIAFRDTDGDGEPGDGEKIGYYFDDNTKSLTVDVPLGGKLGVDITLGRTYYNNNTAISGNISGSADDTMVTVVAYQGGIEAMDVDSFNPDNVVALVEIFKPGFSVDYTGDILPFFQFPVDDVFVFAMIDANGDGVPGDGEIVGFYSADNSPMISISEDGTSGVDIVLDRTYSEHDVSITGNITVTGDLTGEITLVAYKGILDVDAGIESFEMYDVVAYKEVLKEGPGPMPYSLKVLPIFDMPPGSPINDVYVFAIMDVNNNGQPDDDELLGYYFDGSSMDLTIDIPAPDPAGTTVTVPNIDIAVDRTYQDAGTAWTIVGDISLSSDANNSGAAATSDLLIIAFAGEIDDLQGGTINDEDIVVFSTVTAAEIAAAGGYPYRYSVTALPFEFGAYASEVNVFAVLDINGNGIPDAGEGAPGTGDRVGIYLDSEVNPLVSLPSASDVDLEINKIMYDHDSSIKMQIGYEHIWDNTTWPGRHPLDAVGGKVMLLALHEDVISIIPIFPLKTFIFTNPDGVLGMKEVTIGPPVDPYEIPDCIPFPGLYGNPYITEELYELPILTVLDDRIPGPFPIDIYIYAIFDADGDEVFEEEDPFGYFPNIPSYTARIYNLENENGKELPCPGGIWFTN